MSKRTTLFTRWSEMFLVGDECWEWTKGCYPGGYGSIWVNGHSCKGHRVAWELFFGPIPEGLCVLHHCDNPGCVRPSHLFLGTSADNNRDRHSKGRTVARRGVEHWRAKLTPEAVLDIRKRLICGETQASIASSYGVSQPTISDVQTGRQWAYVTQNEGAAS